MKYKKLLVFIAILTSVVLFNYVYSNYSTNPISFHTEREKDELKNVLRSPIDSGEYFLHSSRCEGCHGYDSTNYANIDANGVSVNVVDDWQATMMANSARDPLWRAKVSHEILVNPGHSVELQTKCTSCHAPMGNYTAHFKGIHTYTIDDLDNDSLGLDGVSCVGCHAIGANGLGSMFSGQIPYDSTHKEYGPFQNPVYGPMNLYVGMTPTYSTHVSESKMCSSCHTLLTDGADLSGNLTGRKFIEQATYHEWVNSGYSEDNVTCQKCHMPRVQDSIIIANQYFNLAPRAPFNKHKFMGANTFMIKLIKENKTQLGIKTSDKNFDSTIAVTNRLLKYRTLIVDLMQDSITSDTLFLSFKISNKAGHKFPSGYPSRRAVAELVAVDVNGDTLFKSGSFGNNFEVQNIGTGYQPHHYMINSESQSQIYEMIMGDVNKNRTTVLERADTTLKDNRLPPEGFSDLSSVYDTVKIIGSAYSDPDFNRYNGNMDGSGKDIIHYHLPLGILTNSASIYARVYYQTLPPGWLQEMFSYNSAPIDSFKAMYQMADKRPILIASDSILNLPVLNPKNLAQNELNIYPDPTYDGQINISYFEKTKLNYIKVYNVQGQLVKTLTNITLENHKYTLQLPDIKGTYIIEIFEGNQKTTKKVLFQ